MKRTRLIGLAILIVVPSSLIAWMLNTESGLHWSYQQALPHLPDSVSVTGVSGSLSGQLTLQSIEYEHQGQIVTANQVSLNWDPWGLLRAQVKISQLKIGSLQIVLPVAEDDTQVKFGPGSLPQVILPLGLQLNGAEINAIGITRGSDSYQLDQIRISANLGKDGLNLAYLDIDSENLNASLQGNLKPGGNYPHDLKIGWRTTLPSGASVESSGKIIGNLISTLVTQNLQGALQLNLTLELHDLLTQPAWQAQLSTRSIDSSLLNSQLPPLQASLKLNANGDLNTANLSGQMTAESTELGPLTADFKLTSQGERRFEGLRFDALNIDSLLGQFSASGQLSWSPVLHWEADIAASQVNPVSLLPQWPGDIKAQLSSKGRFENETLTANANLTRMSGTLRGYPVSLQSDLRWQDNGIDVSQFNFKSGETQLKAEGRVGETLDLRWSLDSNDLAELYPQAQGYLTASGQLVGQRAAPTVKASFNGKSLQLPGYRVETIEGRLEADLLNPRQFDINLTGQTLALQGHIIDRLELSADPERIRANLIAADGKAQIAVHGSLDANSWRGRLVQLDIQTQDYFDWTLKKPGALQLSDNSLLADGICLQNSHKGEICGHLDATHETSKIELDVSKLPLRLFRLWIPAALDVDGLVNASADLVYRSPDQLLGKVELDLARGTATLSLKANRKERFDYRFGKLAVQLEATGLKANTTVVLANDDRLEGQLELPGANLFSIDYETQQLQGSARLSTRQLGIVGAIFPHIDKPQGNVDLDIEVSGTLNRPRLRGKARLTEGGFSIPELNLKIARLNIDLHSGNGEKIIYDGDAWVFGSRVTIRGDTVLNATDGWPSQVSLQGKSFNIASLVKPWLPTETTVKGLVAADAHFNFTAPDNLLGNIELSATTGRIDYPLLEGEIEHWEFRDALINLVVDQQGIRGRSVISIGDGNRLDGNLSLPGARLLNLDRKKQAIDARVRLLFEEMAMIEALVPDIDRLRGSLKVNLNVDGTLARPGLSAQAEIIEAAVRIPRLGIAIDDIQLRGASDRDNQFKFQLEASSGAGTLAIEGSSQLDAASGWPTRFKISGNEFEISRIPEATVNVSPDLVVNLRDRSIEINGDLHVPYARLEPKDITSATQVSNDTVIIDSSEKAAPKWLVNTGVNLVLGDRVSFFGFGFEGQLKGRLLVAEKDSQLTRGTGEINIPEGRYRAYGQRLDIENGRLVFTGGPLTNPKLDIRAIRKTNNVTAGIQVRGTLKQPSLELFSIPAMGQTDTLSYLLLGRPMVGASGKDGAMMAQAALALGLAGGDQIARSIGDRFGLDEMRVESDDTGEQASLVLGRFLSPRLYVSYGVGLVGAFNSLNLRYQISQKWQLNAESGESQGADFVYSIER
ncbi:MAG: hypothetical protein GY935_28700 [Gammaproteobacteria bacterium]|nr:hypothetical protein [Gammaproteobacteria bacterium]